MCSALTPAAYSVRARQRHTLSSGKRFNHEFPFRHCASNLSSAASHPPRDASSPLLIPLAQHGEMFRLKASSPSSSPSPSPSPLLHPTPSSESHSFVTIISPAIATPPPSLTRCAAGGAHAAAAEDRSRHGHQRCPANGGLCHPRTRAQQRQTQAAQFQSLRQWQHCCAAPPLTLCRRRSYSS